MSYIKLLLLDDFTLEFYEISDKSTIYVDVTETYKGVRNINMNILFRKLKLLN